MGLERRALKQRFLVGHLSYLSTVSRPRFQFYLSLDVHSECVCMSVVSVVVYHSLCAGQRVICESPSLPFFLMRTLRRMRHEGSCSARTILCHLHCHLSRGLPMCCYSALSEAVTPCRSFDFSINISISWYNNDSTKTKGTRARSYQCMCSLRCCVLLSDVLQL